jgi:hypothetical protein
MEVVGLESRLRLRLELVNEREAGRVEAGEQGRLEQVRVGINRGAGD